MAEKRGVDVLKKLLACIGRRKKAEALPAKEERHMGRKLANSFGGELENSLGNGFYCEYEETPNGYGGYKTVNVYLMKMNDPCFRRCIVTRAGEIQNFPGFRDEDWKDAMDFPIDHKVRFVFCIGPYREGRASVRWLMQPDGRYFEDEDGFGAEHCEEVEMYSFLDEEGRFTEPFFTKEVYAQRQANEPGFPQPGKSEPDKRTELTEEQKRRVAYTSRQLKPELVEKLSRDPEYAKMCMYCKNAPQLLAAKALHEVPEEIVLERCCITFEHPMKTWDGIPFIYLGIEPVGEERYGLWVRVPFSRNTDRVMGMVMRSGTRQELIDYMHSAECGPLFMRCLDEINESLRCHN